MKKFTARYKDQDQGGKWHDMRCVFPLNYGDKLDEQLDECYLNTILDTKEEYLPTTEVEIDINDDGAEVVKNYIVASDNAMECPIGSGKYKHELHLIEPTKLMEGIICQSLAFTNTRQKNNSPSVYAEPEEIEWPPPVMVGSGLTKQPLPKGFLISEYKTPLLENSKFNILSIKSVGDLILERIGINQDVVTDINQHVVTYEVISGIGDRRSSITILTQNGTTEQTDIQKGVEISAIGSFSVEYKIVIEVANSYNTLYWLYDFKYYFVAVESRIALAKWTVWEAAERVLQQAEPRFWVGDGEEGIFLPSATRFILDDRQKDWLSKALAPEFTMTQCTLREQLKLIGSFVHAEPRLIKREGQWVVTFEPYATGNTARSGAYVYKGTSRSINQYCTDIRTTANNIVNRLDYNDGVVVTPNDGGAVTLRTDAVNVRVEDNESSYALTAQEIYDIPSDIVAVECAIYNKDGTDTLLDFTDITGYVVEKTQYDTQFSNYKRQDGTPTKNTVLYYERGQKGIRGLFFKPPNVLDPSLEDYSIVRILTAASGENVARMIDNESGEFNRLAFRISYIPIYSALFSHGKQSHVLTDRLFPFSQIYNQSENIIETRYYGENIKGVAARLGNAEQTRTYRLPSLSLVPRIGDTIDGLYVASTDVSVLPFYVKCTVALTRDFNRLSQYVGISSNKRVYEVSESQAYKRDILLKEYILVGDKPEEKENKTLADIPLFRFTDALKSIFIRETAFSPITAVCAWGGTRKYPVFGNTAGRPVLPVVLLPVISSAFGNSLLFSWTYKDNYSAGERVDYNSEGDVSGYFQSDVGYCDFFGRMRWYNFFLLDKMPESIDKYKFALSYPSIDGGVIPQVVLHGDDPDNPTGIGTIIPTQTDISKPYFIDKDSREILCFNFEIEFKASREDLVIGSGMPFYCNLIGERKREANAQIISLSRPVQQLQRNIRELGLSDEDLEESEEFEAGNISLDGDSLEVDHPLMYESEYWCIYAKLDKDETQVQDDDGEIGTETTYTGGEIILAGRRTDRPIYLTPVHDIYS